MSKRRKKTYTSEQRATAVKIAKESEGKSIGQVAGELGVSESALRKWMRQHEIDAGGGRPGQLTTEEQAEVRALRKELKRVTMERDFLKKAAVFFAKDHSS